jgi:plastocyanin
MPATYGLASTQNGRRTVNRHLVASLGLAAALAIAVAACGGGATPSPAPATAPPASSALPVTPSPAPAGGDAVTIAGFAFEPATVTVQVGATVTWANEDSAPHTVAWADGSQGSGSLAAGGAPYARTFDAAGSFAYVCGIHPAMTGMIVVEP